jgi:carbonic anhydrase
MHFTAGCCGDGLGRRRFLLLAGSTDHRDCGAARIAYGAASISTPEIETETHCKSLDEFRTAVAKRHPGLVVETGLMALDGSLQPLG